MIIMGKPKFSRKKYETPSHPWQADRINEENELIKKYGLKNKKEIWKVQTSLRRYRGQARELLAKIDSDDPQIKRESNQVLSHLTRYNILPLNSTLDDVLSSEIEAILSRRLQTITYLRGFANTALQARQLITHGHIQIDNRKIDVPGYIVTKNEENKIGYISGSPLNDISHPARPTSEIKTNLNKIEEEKEIQKQPEKKEKEIKEKKTDKKAKDEKKPEDTKIKNKEVINNDKEIKETLKDKKNNKEIKSGDD